VTPPRRPRTSSASPDSRRDAPPTEDVPARTGARPGAHVYVLLGEEDVRAEDALRTLLDGLLPVEERSLNLDIVDADETPVQEIITRCETFPFFGARRVVVVRRAAALRAADQEALAAYLDQGPPPSVVMIVAEALDRRRRLYSVLQRRGRIIPCGRLDPEDLPAWVGARVQREGKRIALEASRAFIALVGGGLRELGSEIDKLVAYVGERDTITAGDVRAVSSHVAEATVFDLMDAVGHRRGERALLLLQSVLALGEPPVRILYMLEDQLRMILRTKTLVDRRARPAEVRETLGTRAWLFSRYRHQAVAFADMDVTRMLGLLLETDALIKTGGASPRLALETLIVRLSADA
jgi:DNA polymerase III subunit delta